MKKIKKYVYAIVILPMCYVYTGVAVVNNQVYVCGGFNGSLRVRTVDVYDPVKDVWTTVQPMEARRSTLGAAVLDNMVYAVGGFDGSSGENIAYDLLCEGKMIKGSFYLI